jgi:hypothetical protein
LSVANPDIIDINLDQSCAMLASGAPSTFVCSNTSKDASVAPPKDCNHGGNLSSRATDTTYMAWATDFNNDAEVKETREFLNQTIVDKNHFITKFKAHDGSLTVVHLLYQEP